MMAAMVAAIVWLGLYPQPVLNTAKQSLHHLQHIVMTTPEAPQTARPALDNDRVMQPAPAGGGN
jgi:NADH:ubiquinone oxidoreductase subunit 4 (subunit M)